MLPTKAAAAHAALLSLNGWLLLYLLCRAERLASPLACLLVYVLMYCSCGSPASHFGQGLAAAWNQWCCCCCFDAAAPSSQSCCYCCCTHQAAAAGRRTGCTSHCRCCLAPAPSSRPAGREAWAWPKALSSPRSAPQPAGRLPCPLRRRYTAASPAASTDTPPEVRHADHEMVGLGGEGLSNGSQRATELTPACSPLLCATQLCDDRPPKLLK